jgi:hypothetical protein
VRDDVLMNKVNENDHPSSAAQGSNGSGEHGVLAKLPRTRPQRSSARRAAARRATTPNGPADSGSAPEPATARASAAPRGRGKPAAGRVRSAATPKRAPLGNTGAAERSRGSAPGPTASARKPRASREPGPAPRQGFEAEGDSAHSSLQPPGGAELIASAAEIVGDVAKAGLSRSERLLKDLISRLPLN